MNKKTDPIEEFDFGFSIVDDDDYEEVKKSTDKLQEEVEELQNRVVLLHQTILPFLNNLCKNPKKSTIHWPNRVEKIEEFKNKLEEISEGKHT